MRRRNIAVKFHMCQLLSLAQILEFILVLSNIYCLSTTSYVAVMIVTIWVGKIISIRDDRISSHCIRAKYRNCVCSCIHKSQHRQKYEGKGPELHCTVLEYDVRISRKTNSGKQCRGISTRWDDERDIMSKIL